MELLDEIERQTPTFRLMMSNIRVLVQMEAPDTAPRFEPVEPSEVVRKIVDRYTSVAAESERELTWWAEPVEFGMVYSDGSAVEHIVTNLVDNAVRFASEHIEVKITKNPTHFFVRVLGRRPGNRPPLCSAYLRSRLDAGSGEEGGEVQLRPGALFIARTLANGCGGDLAVESVETPDPQHHTAFLMSLPLGEVTRS